MAGELTLLTQYCDPVVGRYSVGFCEERCLRPKVSLTAWASIFSKRYFRQRHHIQRQSLIVDNPLSFYHFHDSNSIPDRVKRSRLLILLPFLLFSVLAQAQSGSRTVIAKAGDGIYLLLRQNGLDPAKYYREFVKLNKKNISKNNGLYIGRAYILPANEEVQTEEKLPADTISESEVQVISDTVSTPVTTPEAVETKEEEAPAPVVVKEPLFGQDNAEVVVENEVLKGAIYYLISGHGGPDPGALIKQGRKLVSEDEYAYDVNLRLARKLMAQGAEVYIIIRDPNDGIRDKKVLEVDYDEVNYPKERIPRSQRLRLRQRTETVNGLFLKNSTRSSYQRLVVTHVDSRSVGEVIDVFFYHHHRSTKGKRLAESLQDTFKQKYARYQPNRKYAGTVASRSSLYVIKNTLPAMVYIELGNLKNTRDQKRILDYENRDALAKWISEGLVADYKKE
jgi:N-acetylmuramoyl-L-alanine amidase